MIDLAVLWQQVAIHLWQTSWVLLALFGIARLARRSSASTLHTIYGLALVKILVPNALLVSLLPPGLQDAARTSADAMLAPIHALGPIYALSPFVESVHFDGMGALAWAVTLVWICGAGYRLLLLRRQIRLTQRVTRDTLPLPDAQLAICREMGLPPGSVRLGRDGARINSPFTAGFLCPRIVLPYAALTSYTREAMRAVLAHEDRHRRRRDPLRMLGGRLLQALLFFYPPVSYVLRRIEETNELLCDQAALARGIDPESYLSALSLSVRSALEPRSALLARPALFAEMRSTFSFLSRCDRIRHPRRYQSMSRAISLSLAALLCVAGGVFLTQSFHAQPVAAGTGEETDAPFDVPPVLDDEYSVAVEYPENEEHVAGTVFVSVDIAADGTVSNAEIKQGIEGHPAFAEQVLRVVVQWRFIPAQRDGEPVASTVMIPVKFDPC